MATERLYPVGEPAQAGPTRELGAADAVVRHLNHQARVEAPRRDPYPRRARMLGGVDETLGADEVGDRGHRRRQPLVFGVDLDQERKAPAEFLQRGDQSALGQRMWMDATRQLLQLLAKAVELASQLFSLHFRLLKKLGDKAQPRLASSPP